MNRKKLIQSLLLLLVCAAMLLSLTACSKKESTPEEDDEEESSEKQEEEREDQEEDDEQPEKEKAAEEPAVYETYKFDESTFIEYEGTVEHIFFHQIVAYPELAFDGDAEAKGIDDWMCTIPEFLAIMDNLYEKGYILIDMNDIWSEYTDENGNPFMMRNTIRIPEGRIPFVLSFDDISYYSYMPGNGFMRRLIIGDDGEIWCEGEDPSGNTIVAQGLDVVTLLDKYVKEHPDFSLNGAKGCLSLTGYAGILGYETYTDTRGTAYYDPELRAREMEAVKPVIARLKETGWYFGSHTWGHIRLDNKSLETVQKDTQRWLDEVGSLVGPTKLLFYPHGARPDGGDDVTKSGPVLKYLYSQGFRVFASVGVNSFSKVKTDLPVVVCDRLHPDGTTLRWARSTYLKFYDAKEVYDYANRSDYGYDWSK